MHIEEVALGIELAQLKRRALRVLIRLAETAKEPKEARLLCALIIRAQPTNFQPEMKVNNYTAKLAIELPTLDPNEEEYENETSDEADINSNTTHATTASNVPRPSPSPSQPDTPSHHGDGRAPSASVPTPTPTPTPTTTPSNTSTPSSETSDPTLEHSISTTATSTLNSS